MCQRGKLGIHRRKFNHNSSCLAGGEWFPWSWQISLMFLTSERFSIHFRGTLAWRSARKLNSRTKICVCHGLRWRWLYFFHSQTIFCAHVFCDKCIYFYTSISFIVIPRRLRIKSTRTKPPQIEKSMRSHREHCMCRGANTKLYMTIVHSLNQPGRQCPWGPRIVRTHNVSEP